MRNVDFVPGKDTDRGAEWMRRAVSENLAFQRNMNEMTGWRGETQPGAVESEGKAAVESGFAWTQGDDELEVVVTFDDGVDKNAVKVTFQPRLLKVLHKGEEKLSFRLYERIDVGSCTWTIDGKDLILTMEKAAWGIMWPRIKGGAVFGPRSLGAARTLPSTGISIFTNSIRQSIQLRITEKFQRGVRSKEKMINRKGITLAGKRRKWKDILQLYSTEKRRIHQCQLLDGAYSTARNPSKTASLNIRLPP